MFDSTAQICWGLPNPRNAVDGTVWERMPWATIRTFGTRYGPSGRVTALRDGPVGDVRVRPDEVGLDVAEDERPVAPGTRTSDTDP